MRKNGWLSEKKLKVIGRRFGEQGKEVQQKDSGINHPEEILARLNVEIEVNGINEADIPTEANKTAEITP